MCELILHTHGDMVGFELTGDPVDQQPGCALFSCGRFKNTGWRMTNENKIDRSNDKKGEQKQKEKESSN